MTTAANNNDLQSERAKFEAEQASFQAELELFRRQQEELRRSEQQSDSPSSDSSEHALQTPTDSIEVDSVIAPVEETPAANEPEAASAEDLALRSELANLFGIETTPIDHSQSPALPSIEPETIPEPEPLPPPMPTPEPAAELPQDVESDDYMQAYMANLLARTRSSEGPDPVPPPKPAPKPAPKIEPLPMAEAEPAPTISSYEAYKRMSGQGSTPVDTVVAPTAPQPEAVQAAPRPRIDREFARAQRDSLREVASRSAQAHVASHAWKKNRPQVVMQTGVMLTGFIVGGIVLAAHTMQLVDAYEVAALFFGIGLIGASMLVRRMQMIRKMKIQAYREATRVVKGTEKPVSTPQAAPEENTFVLADIDNYID